MVMKEVVDEFANIDEKVIVEIEKKANETEKLRQVQAKKQPDLTENKEIESTKQGGRRTKSKPRKVSPLVFDKD